MIVLPGGGYATHAPNEAEPIVDWLNGLGVESSVFRYPLHARHPAPLEALRTDIRRLRHHGAEHVGVIGFSAGGHLAGLAALAPDAAKDASVQFAVLGHAITSMETETYRPSRMILLGEDASPDLRRATSLDALVTPPDDAVDFTSEDDIEADFAQITAGQFDPQDMPGRSDRRERGGPGGIAQPVPPQARCARPWEPTTGCESRLGPSGGRPPNGPTRRW
ncbi:alpha/beta hydrolase [Streptomyces sp. NPDC020794]|uniref:alpha/beta hydrolase n=1 Tax=unclassified Streptomyces TaxID=2593676 RepID=UPI0036E2F6F2